MKHPRLFRFFRFSLRGVLLAFALLAVLLAILSAPLRQAARQRQVIREVKRLGGRVWFADEWYQKGDETGYRSHHSQDASLTWYETYVSDGYLRKVVWIDLDQQYDLPANLLQSFATLPHLERLSISPYVASKSQIEQLKKRNPHCVITEQWYWGNAPVTTHCTHDSFREAIWKGSIILLIDGGPSSDTTLSTPVYFEAYAKWLVIHPDSDVQFLRIRDLHSHWLADVQLSRDLKVEPSEIQRKSSERVLWMQDRVVLRYDASFREATIEDILERTERVFGIAESAATH